jgi:hypothetical protein
MTLVIGTDEAGYGPNLGPLVVAASAWRVTGAGDVGERLSQAADDVARAAGLTMRPWADSKRLHRPGGGLAPLERGVLAALHEATLGGCGGPVPADGAALAKRLGFAVDSLFTPPEWGLFGATRLPTDTTPGQIVALAEAAASMFPRHGVECIAITCRVLHPGAFNHLLDAGLNKSDILSQTTLDLAASLRALAPGEPVLVWCDRHGGRKAYAPLVGRHFAAPLVQTLEETPARSRYAIPADRLRIEFAVGGESQVPVALSSMTAKYVRELAMAAFNAHWRERSPGLLPTAGYPLDARRWWEQAAGAVRKSGIGEAMLWRKA